jgi:glycosyltransferase involved in cell wall biosynthesis
MLKVLVVGQTPPPSCGQAIMIDRLVKSDLAGVQLIHVRMAFSATTSEMCRVSMFKIMHMFQIIAQIIYHRFLDGARILYYPPAGPDRVPMIRDVAILMSTRWLFDKTVFHFHAGGVSELYDRLPRWQKWLFRRAYFGADAAIRLSELNPDDGCRLHAKRDVVIPYGIDDPFPQQPIADSDVSAGEPLNILFVGILRESKGVMVLLEACGELASRGVPFRVEVMGQWQSEEFAELVRARTAELKIETQIQFLGVLTGADKFAAFRRANVLCFPTFYHCETFGVVLLEAMASGLATVSTRWRGIPSIIDDGESGFLVEPRNHHAVANRLEMLANDPQLRQRMGYAGRAKFEREFTFPRFASRMRSVLLETAGAMPTMPRQSLPGALQAAPAGQTFSRLSRSLKRLGTQSNQANRNSEELEVT